MHDASIPANKESIHENENHMIPQMAAEIYETRILLDTLATRLENERKANERQKILNWLSQVDYSTQHKDLVSQYQEGTWRWILESERFQSWVEEEGQLLFLTGTPGAGKTMISSMVIEHLNRDFQEGPGTGVAYFYCNYGKQSEYTLFDILASLVKQLSSGDQGIPSNVSTLYAKYLSRLSRPSIAEISELLCSVASGYERIFVVVDGLDEYSCHDSLVSAILRLHNTTTVNLFLTSRRIPAITRQFRAENLWGIQASTEDLHKYLGGNMFRLPSFLLHRPELRQGIKDVIIKEAGGMLVFCYDRMEEYPS
jgi:Cdc6-like AAA superfamily ATPase